MARIIIAVIIGACLLEGASTISADVVYLDDGQILYGRVISDEPDAIVFKQRMESTSSYRERRISKNRIIAIVVNIKTTRLEALDPGNPEGYQELAEELSSQKRDPEARDMAIRLFLLGARNGGGDLRAGCFAGLIPLARSRNEELRIRALANIEIAKGESWLVEPVFSETSSNADIDSADVRQQLLESLLQLRTGRRQQAATALGKDWAEQAMEPFADICSWQQLRQWSSEPELKTEWLAKVLELEIAIGNPSKMMAHPDPSSLSWAEMAVLSNDATDPVSFDNVTGFDLTKNVFREGKWTTLK